MKEFNLSENVHHPNECSVCKIDDFSKVYFESDVKEFIRLLKERLKYLVPDNEEIGIIVQESIDKLAGEKLR